MLAQNAVSIRINWQRPIKELYANDLALGVIEGAQADEDSEWWVKQDAYAMEYAFNVERQIPGNT